MNVIKALLRFVGWCVVHGTLAAVAIPTGETEATTSVCDEQRDDIRFFGSGGDAGRIELCWKATWRLVCAKDWNFDMAQVACRQLGYQSAFMANTARNMAFMGDSGVFNDVGIHVGKCQGDETSLRQCEIRESTSCHLDNAIAAACSTAQSNDAASTFPIELEKDVHMYMQNMQSWFQEEETRRLDQLDETWTSIPQSEAQSECVDETDSPQELISNSLPNPFQDAAAIQQAFLFPDSVVDIYRHIQSSVFQKFQQSLAAEIPSQLSQLQWNTHGIDLSNFIPPNSTRENLQTLLDTSPMFQAIRDLFLAANQHNALHWYLDTSYRYYTQPDDALAADPIAQDLFATLQRDGFVPIDDFGLDMDTFVPMAQAALQGDALYQKNETSIAGGGSIITSRKPFAILDQALIHNTTLNRVITAYLGPSILHGYKITHLNHGLKSTAQYNAGMYHHDRVGRRLKLFIFLNDVDCERGHPTRVAAGSQKILYYKSEDYPVTRFANDYVEQHYPILKGCGPRGGGFLFDTHTLHKGTVEGDLERTVVIAEYHHVAKCAYSKEHNLGIPCPGGDIYRTDAPLKA